MAGRIARGDIRLYKFAPPDKKRPVVVLTRESALAYLSTVTAAPITSTIRGVPSEVVLDEADGMKTPCAANLHNVVNRLAATLGEARGPVGRCADAGDLRRVAVLDRLRDCSGSA